MKKTKRLPLYTLLGVIMFLLTLITSCEKHQSSALDGSYTIRKMTVNGKDLAPDLCLNSFGFRSRPSEAWFHGSRFYEKDHHAQWKIIGDNDSVEIKSTIAILNGRYKILRSKNHNNARLDLVGETVQIESYKVVD